jgi:hypothetical protein
MKKDKLILPIAILLASVCLGGFYYSVEISKQKFIEKQELANTENQRGIDLFNCIADVDNRWASYIESVKGTPEANKFFNGITPEQQTEIDNCNSQYSPK